VCVFKGENSETDEEPTSDDVGLNCISQTPSTYLYVVKRVSSLPAKKDDWRKSATFHTFTKIEDKSCKVIVDSENCINTISSKSLEYFGLEVVPQLHPFTVSWIDSTALEAKQLYLVPVNFSHYKDNIWCDVITMNVGQVILGRPWLFDKNVTIYVRSNMCQFEHEGKQIKLLPPLSPKTGQPNKHPLWHCRQLHRPTSHCYCFPLPLTSHAYPARKLLSLSADTIPQ